MYHYAATYYRDLGALAALSLPAFFNMVRRIPYLKDVKGQEVVARPALLLKEFPALDCKKKAILIGAYCIANRIPFRFVASSQRRDAKAHHVYPQAFLSGVFQNVDATYPHYRLFQPKNGLTKADVLKP